ncbi:MAG: hypothetical protein JNL57_00510 [Bacteroidetes bacterium]|nr:hypothetical protein [Bacteroidota bacterium]
MKRILIVTLSIASVFALDAQNARKYVNEFMHIGVGARQFGMGKAGVASVRDVYSCYWNPASLGYIKDNLQVGFMHNFYFQNIANMDYLALTAKGKKQNGFGLSMLRFGVDGILNTMDLIQNGEVDYNRVTQFNAVDYCFAGSYGEKRRLIRNYNYELSWGTSAKFIHRKVGEFASAWGFGMDAAVGLHDVKGKWGFSVVGRDITSTFNNWSFHFTNRQKDVLYLTGNTIPESSLEIALPRFCTGGFYRYTHENWILQGEANLDLTTDGKRNTLLKTGLISADLRLGAEGGIRNEEKGFELLFRAGIYNFQKEIRQNGKSGYTFQPTAGVGIVYNNLHLDYALAGFGAGGTGLYSNIISLHLGINKTAR